jgi:indole-3-glycerol phosphate synthase
VIAEVKKASPSRGVISDNFDPVGTARAYADGGAAALSVLTDQRFFQGSLADLQVARAAVSIPVLRKDFTLDEFHVIEAAAHGADAILLIAAILSVKELETLRLKAAEYQMAALVEVHDSEELQRAIDSGAHIIGVNNRDLRTFEIRTELSLELAPKIPKNVVKVSESGIHDHSQVKELMAAGYQAFLVGEHLMRSSDPAAELKKLQGV